MPGIGIKQLIGTLSGARIEVAQDFQHSQPIVFGFAHADDPAATNGHTAFLHGGNGVEAVLKCMRAHNFRIKLGRSVEVMVVGRNASGFEFARFHGPDFSESNAHLHPELAYFPNDLQHALKLFRAIAHAAPGRAHAKPGRALCARPVCRNHDLFQRQQFFALEPGGIMSGLRTISAIFAASAGLDAKQTASLHFFATPMLKMNSPALRDEIEQRLMIKRW